MLKKILFASMLAGSGLFAKDVIEFKDVNRIEAGKALKLPFQLQDAETRQVRLHMDVRFDWKTLFGYTYGMSVQLNGQPVSGARLLNKPLRFRTRNGGGSIWAAVDKNNYNIMYSPDFSDQIQTDEKFIYGLYEKDQQPYTFVLDLSGIASHVGTNELVIQSTYSVPLILRNVRIEIDEKKMPRLNDPAAMVRPAPAGPLPDHTLKPLPVGTPSLKTGSNGAVTVFGIPLESRFSLPGGKWLEVKSAGKMTAVQFPYEKTWTTPEYTVCRRISAENGRIKIADTFTNRRNQVTGVLFENTLLLPEKPIRVLLGGIEVNLPECKNPTHPSIFARLKSSAVAMVAEDDILRNQGYYKSSGNTIAAGDRNLGLPPNGSHTLEWSVYDLPNGDYYDFVNAVRRDWDSNFTWNGTLEFPYMGGGEPLMRWTRPPVPKKTVDDFLKERPVNLLMTHVASDISTSPSKATREKPFLGHGTAILGFQWWGAMTKNTVDAFRKYAPHVEIYAYMHKNLCSEPGNREKYQDSIAMDENSRTLSAREIYARYVPTPANSYGKKLAETYRYLVDGIGANIYMDEICLGVTEWAPYAEWDGCTVEVDPATHEVIRKLSIPNLLTKPWLEDMMKFLKSRGRKLLANGPPATRTLHRHHAMQFVEHGMGESGLVAAHFATPLAWDYSRGVPGFIHFRDSLDFGALALTWSGPWSVQCFPFTPMEIRPGYLIGKERIITRLSGKFGWNDRCDAEVYVYDGNGKQVEKPDVKIKNENGKTVFEVRMPSDHVAIIVRKKAL
ncbi:MAG: hypothetical protein BWY31_03180 [Lentisphaerae bacterium ADurb.Bin242]|nr:MAG: hypothetical protein BWY31_03180 [Lentisphaerae bacterium ADurb.Bin242]